MRFTHLLAFAAALSTGAVARADTFHYDYTYQNQTSTFGFTYDSPNLITTDETVTPSTCQLYTTCASVSIDPTESEIIFNNSFGGTLTLNNLPANFFTLGQHVYTSTGTNTISITDVPAAVTPEPSALLLVSTGLLSVAVSLRRRVA